MVEKTSIVNFQLISDFKNKVTPIFNSKFKQDAQLIGKFINDNTAERFLIANTSDMNKAID